MLGKTLFRKQLGPMKGTGVRFFHPSSKNRAQRCGHGGMVDTPDCDPGDRKVNCEFKSHWSPLCAFCVNMIKIKVTIMRLQQVLTLVEMTMRVNSYEDLGNYVTAFEYVIAPENHCGDIEQHHVYKHTKDNTTNYAISEDSKTVVGFFQVVDNEFTTIYITPALRGKGMFGAVLWFLKRNEGMSRIVLGKQHSEASIESIKRISDRFNVYWTNGTVTHPYNPNTVNQYYSIAGPTEWRVVLEHSGDFTLWEKYWNPTNLETYYYALLTT